MPLTTERAWGRRAIGPVVGAMVVFVLAQAACAPSVDAVSATGTVALAARRPPRFVELAPGRRPGAVRLADLPDLRGAELVREWIARDPRGSVLVDQVRNRVVHATGRLSEPSKDSDESVLRTFLRHNRAVLDLDAPDEELALQRGPTTYSGSRFYRYRQVIQGIPVLRRSIKIEIGSDGSVRTLSGATSSQLGALPALAPTISADEARVRVLAEVSLRRGGASVAAHTAPVLMLAPGDQDHPARLIWRAGALVLERGKRGLDPRAWLVSLDAHTGESLGLADTTRSCTDGQAGTVVTSSESVRSAIEGEAPAGTRPLQTCYSSVFEEFFLEDHHSDASLYCYDASADSDPMSSALWFSTCTEPLCYAMSSESNDWVEGAAAERASDFRNAQKVLDLFEQRFGRVGADGSGENLILASGMAYDNARSVGMYRTIAIGAADPAAGKPSWGVLDVMAHEFAHIVSWHEWMGLFDYGFEGAVHGAERAVDEHLADMFGVIALAHAADEPWVADVRWAHGAERSYRRNYLWKSFSNFFITVDAARNYYKATNDLTPCGHASLIAVGGDDSAAYTNAVLLGRAVYLYTEGGFVHQNPYGVILEDWPEDGPTHHVDGIGTEKMEAILYHSVTAGEFATSVGAVGYADIDQVDEDIEVLTAEFEKVAHIEHASCLALSAEQGWPDSVCASVRAAYAGVGLMSMDEDAPGVACEADRNGAPCLSGRCVQGDCTWRDEAVGANESALEDTGCHCEGAGTGNGTGRGWGALVVCAGLALGRHRRTSGGAVQA